LLFPFSAAAATRKERKKERKKEKKKEKKKGAEIDLEWH
jgi:hypothetical protein